ncbi:Ubiquitin--protein ligase [Fagus crenata]
MSHDNGYHMSTLLLQLDIPNNDLAVMLQKIIDVAVGIVVEAGTSRMQQSIDVLITYTTTECIVIQLPDSIPTIESSIDAFENVNTMDTVVDIVEKDAFEDSIEKCIICLEEWENGDLAYQLPCVHVYHNDCIDRWLEDNQSCPVCRYSMPSY